MRISLVLAAAASLLGVSAPALADDDRWRGGRAGQWDDRGYRRGGGDNKVYVVPARGYPQRGYYQPGWQGRGYDPRYRGGYGRGFENCRGNSGVTGALLGAVVGGVLGDQVAQPGDKTVGTVVGAGLGGVLGAAIERSGRDPRCR
jgi:hypothetical protein